MSCQTVRSRRLLSSCPVAIWNRRLNSSSLASRSRVSNSSSEVTCFARDDPALHRQLVNRASKRLPSNDLVRERQLEQHPAWFHVSNPPLRRALARAHPGLSGLLRQRTVWVDIDPHLAATTDSAVDRDTGRLDLPVRHIGRLQRLDAVFAKGDAGAAARHATAAW